MYYDLSKVSLSLLQRLVSGQKVGDKLFAGLVHDSSDHGLGHHLHLLSRADPCWGRISVEDDLTELALMYMMNINHSIRQSMFCPIGDFFYK